MWDLATQKKLNDFAQAVFDIKPAKRIRNCLSCGLPVDKTTHRYSEKGGYDCKLSGKPATAKRYRYQL